MYFEGPDHNLLLKGTNQSRDHRAVRVLIKVDFVVTMLRNGELTDHGVEFEIATVVQKMGPKIGIESAQCHHIKKGDYIPIDKFEDITKGPMGIFKVLELSAEFDTKMTRYQLENYQNVSDAERKSALLLWADTIVAEKRRQMNNGLSAILPWTVTNVFEMPMVIWLKKGRDEEPVHPNKRRC